MEVAANGDKMTVAIHARAVEFIEFDLHAYWTDKSISVRSRHREKRLEKERERIEDALQADTHQMKASKSNGGLLAMTSWPSL